MAPYPTSMRFRRALAWSLAGHGVVLSLASPPDFAPSGVGRENLQRLRAVLTAAPRPPVAGSPSSAPSFANRGGWAADREAKPARADHAAFGRSTFIHADQPAASTVASPKPPLDAVGGTAAIAGGSEFTGVAFDEGVRAYRMALALGARRFRAYPVADGGAAPVGRVGLSLRFAPGIAPELTLASSSGNPDLDRAAMTMIRAAVDEVGPPEGLRGRRFVIDLPVEFLAPP